MTRQRRGWTGAFEPLRGCAPWVGGYAAKGHTGPQQTPVRQDGGL